MKAIFRRAASRITIAGAILAACILPVGAARGAVDNDIRGKVIVGYQGWFGAPGDGSGGGWRHYSLDPSKFTRETTTFEMWPDMSEAGPSEKFPTDFRLKDGGSAYVFSAANGETVRRHFRWMRDYGIAGAALQRFGSDLRDPVSRAFRDRVLANCRVAANENGRIWYLMYDLSGLDDSELNDVLAADWMRLVDASDPRKDATYARYGGKPVVCLWGIGFNDHRKYSLKACARLIDFLKNSPVYGGNSVILGVPYFWRQEPEGRPTDSVSLSDLGPLLKKADIVSPWAVGRYGSLDGAAAVGPKAVAPDLAWCRANDLGYQPVIFSGFRWNNLMRTRGKPASSGIPRAGGKFLWAQAASAIDSGAAMLYIAMFDEIDEGTAIFKVANDAPVPEGSFLTYEGLPSDFYLRLAGKISEALAKGAPVDPAVLPPIPLK
ncbi:MAG TPA: glycoside hydrolase family 71/99-like protein [Candidatus Methylacidiphilales bacterium]